MGRSSSGRSFSPSTDAAHPVERVLVRDDAKAAASTPATAATGAADRPPRRWRVAASVIGVRVRVDRADGSRLPSNRCRSAARSFSVMSAGPLSTSRMPSSPTCAVTFTSPRFDHVDLALHVQDPHVARPTRGVRRRRLLSWPVPPAEPTAQAPWQSRPMPTRAAHARRFDGIDVTFRCLWLLSPFTSTRSLARLSRASRASALRASAGIPGTSLP